jgi:hypothetical protein
MIIWVKRLRSFAINVTVSTVGYFVSRALVPKPHSVEFGRFGASRND